MVRPDTDFEDFFETHYRRVVTVLGLGWRDAPAAEEAAQEAFTRALVRWRRVGGMDRPDGWVYVTAANILRRRGRTEAPSAPPSAPVHTAADIGDGLATRLVVRDALALLPDRQRQVVVLRYLADLSTDETARVMGCASGTVKASLAKALRALRVELEEDHEDR